MFSLRILLFILVLANTCMVNAQTVFEVEKGYVSINSNAANEFIRASSVDLKGVINIDKKQFVFKIDVGTFGGFNSPLQQEHFHENYMETYKFPEIIFSGKVIEDVNLEKVGKYRVRAKGKLTVHGVSVDRIIYANVRVSGSNIEIISEFKVALADHDIKIPRVVNDKLATEIFIVVKSTLVRKQV